MKYTTTGITQMSRIADLMALSVLACVTVKAAEVKVTAANLNDQRMTDQFFGGGSLGIRLKVTGDVVKQAQSLRAVAESAVDDTGGNLLKKSKPEFKKIGEGFSNVAKTQDAYIELELQNPARRAAQVKEVAGELELFVPQRDAQSTITVTDFGGQAGQPIAAPALKAAAMEIMILTKERYEADVAAQKKKLADEKAAAKTSVKKESAQFGIALFNSLGNLTANRLALYVKDPQSRLVEVTFEDEKGKPIRVTESMSSGQTQIFEFAEKLPPTTRIKLYVATPKSLVKVPFKLSNLTLP